jgi:trans-feruloyl-CoA hydratase/vanillin synthase
MVEMIVSQMARAADQQVVVEFDEEIAWVRINRPEKRNAISPALAAKMSETLDALETDERCAVVVITGTDPAFHSGMDLKEFFRATDSMQAEARRRLSEINADWQWRRLLYYAKPTIAMVNGYCFGGGLNPVCACDVAIASETAIFGVSEVNWGIIPAGNVLKLLSSVVSPRDGLWMSISGEPFDGRKAAELRLVNEVVPHDKLRERTREVAKLLAGKNPFALRATKHAFRRVQDMSWEDAEDYLYAKLAESRFLDPEKGRDRGMAQFLDEKSYRPGLGSYRRTR